mmetsp:Transcript_17628/g.29777  ORF Transcript_17628/g.29777 Transcript_17628/m.29777 type:complete len:168 (+) Transcript_17628:644-1147(+)
MALMKTNFETMQAVHYISKRTKKKISHFGIAGNKDKRGITTQVLTLTRGNGEALIKAQMAKDWDHKVMLGSFKRVWEPVQLGQLKGNRFSVALRFIDNSVPDEEIAERVRRVEQAGFINYFGLQRFGSYNIRTHEIGKHILKMDWEGVVRLILSQHADFDQGQKARK